MPKVIKKKTEKSAAPVSSEEDVKNIIHQARESLGKRRDVLLPALGGALAVILLAAGLFIYRSNAHARADALEYEGYRIYYNLQQKQPMASSEQYQKALEKFKEAYDKRKSAYALFYIADCYYGMGKNDDALKTLKELTERYPDDERFVPLAMYKMALIDIKKGDKEGALKLLDGMASAKGDILKDLALSESAKLLVSMGKPEEASKKAEELNKKYQTSPYAVKAPEKPAAAASAPEPAAK